MAAGADGTRRGAPPLCTVDVPRAEPEDVAAWQQAGLEAIAGNELAVVTLAGGQGSRHAA